MNIRGQGTTEYLIILAVVIVIALVVVGVLGFVPGIGGSTTEQQLTLTEITLDGSSTAASALSVADTVVGPGKTASVSGTYSTAGDDCTDLGDTKTFAYEISVTYNTANISGKNQVGDRPLVGKCQN